MLFAKAEHQGFRNGNGLPWRHETQCSLLLICISPSQVRFADFNLVERSMCKDHYDCSSSPRVRVRERKRAQHSVCGVKRLHELLNIFYRRRVVYYSIF